MYLHLRAQRIALAGLIPDQVQDRLASRGGHHKA
jgi:hypothetical protein